ncbi:16638_t:CDS:2 [Rhizophagus irregularis]|nr:16638_t:CDS:2 [Rhizophagus irregularis]
MVRKGHFLTPYVVVLHSVKKANSCNKYAVCRACISANIKPPKKRSHRTSISNDSSSENESDASYHSIANEFSDNEISQDINTLDNYIFRPLTSAQKHKFEQLLLEVTVSLLGGQILKETTSNESEILLKNAKRDQFDVTLTFDAQKFKNINIATSLSTTEDNNILEQETDNISDNGFSDTDCDNTASLNINKNIQNVDEWHSMIFKWLSMLDDEQGNEVKILEELKNDSNNSNDNKMEYDINIMNISNLPHPARDKNAKWRLQDIFTENLGEPSYLSDFK